MSDTPDKAMDRSILPLPEPQHPAITEIDGLMIQDKNSVACRDRLWKVLHELHTAIAGALAKVTAQDAAHWFASCGYGFI